MYSKMKVGMPNKGLNQVVDFECNILPHFYFALMGNFNNIAQSPTASGIPAFLIMLLLESLYPYNNIQMVIQKN